MRLIDGRVYRIVNLGSSNTSCLVGLDSCIVRSLVSLCHHSICRLVGLGSSSVSGIICFRCNGAARVASLVRSSFRIVSNLLDSGLDNVLCTLLSTLDLGKDGILDCWNCLLADVVGQIGNPFVNGLL